MGIETRISVAALLMASLAFWGCAPLAGKTVDPLAPVLGLGRVGPPAARDQWVGQYEDSRGSGELVVQLQRVGSRIEGSWQLRTGGDGTLTGTQAEDGSTVQFQFASQGGTCPVLLDGKGEISGTTWTATYSGRDCQGPVANGRFSLTKR